MAPTGAVMAFLALFTGAFWGRPTWGAYWVWDARLTSELILLFLYLGFLALQSAVTDWKRADKACALIAIVGVERSHHLFFGEVVEHPASGRVHYVQRFFHAFRDACDASCHGGGLLDLQLCGDVCPSEKSGARA